MALNLFTIPAHLPFLEVVARSWLARGTGLDAARGLILVPTRRAARALSEAFLRVSGGRPLLLPRIAALGALDEAPLALSGALDLPPAVDPVQRLAVLTRLILAMNGAAGAPTATDRAWLLASDLASLMDEAERSEIDLARALPDAAEPEFAAHWAETLKFLHIVTQAWPAWLDANGVMNPAARQVALLNAQAKAWESAPPKEPILVAGVAAGIPPVVRLLRAVAAQPEGTVILPALDLAMERDAWDAIETSHAQAGLRNLLAGLGATRGDVRVLPDSAAPGDRFALLTHALLPAPAMPAWQDARPFNTAGLTRLRAQDQQEEATAIAIVLREAIETPGAHAALVTPDRDLAARVSAALLRFGIVADDSAGEPLAETPPAVFLRLLAVCVDEELAPVPLLALLKHPFAAAGRPVAEARRAARALELACLRGPRPAPGLPGIRQIIDRAGNAASLRPFWDAVEQALEPALRIRAGEEVPPSEALDGLIVAAERLASTHETDGRARLWAHEEGEALATLLASARRVMPILPDQKRGIMPGLITALLQGHVVRSRRALRGRDGAEHPRVAIWGLLEARLQSADTIVLGGLVEGVWPPAPEPGPWMSRPMRAKAGLPSPEEIVGQSAHDFLASACAAPRVVLSCPVRRDGAPAVPARWLTRLQMLLEGRGTALPDHPASGWARKLDLPAGDPTPVAPPRPKPPVSARPRRLSVTEIETWLRDPYSIYAKHVLQLKALRPLDEETDAADYGTLVHDGLHRFLARFGLEWPHNAEDELRRCMQLALQKTNPRSGLRAWWTPRLDRIATWVAATETERRADAPLAHIASEVKGTLVLARPGGPFTLVGRADRIERRQDGTLCILDYKTGTPPAPKDVTAGYAAQLLLEASMAAAASFGNEVCGEAAALVYWHLSGGREPGKALALFKGDPAETAQRISEALSELEALIDKYDEADRCYLAQPHPEHAARFSDYKQLARVAEWSAFANRGAA